MDESLSRKLLGISLALLCLFTVFQLCQAQERLNPEMIPPEAIPQTSTTPVQTPAKQAPAQTAPMQGQAASGQHPYSEASTPGLSNMSSKSFHAGYNKNVPLSEPMGPNVSGDNKKDPTATIDTSKGKIVIRLFRKLSPQTAASFIELSQKGFYNGLTFHRVEPGFVIQGGDPNGDGTGFYTEPETGKPRMIKLEINPRLRHNAPGVVAMAHSPRDPNSNSCQFYITLSAQPALDFKYSIFGGVIEGMDVVNQIAIGDKINSITIEEQK